MPGRSAVFAALLIATSAEAQAYRAPHTAFGQPDLQGIWSDVSLTPLERRKEFTTLTLDAAQAAAFEKGKADRYAKDTAPTAAGGPAPPAVDEVEDEAEQWNDKPPALARIGGQARTSWIVDPADGKLPYTAAARAAAVAQKNADDHVFDDPEARPFDERCLLGVGGTAGPPILNTGSNSQLQILQAPGYVVIVAEMIHDARIVRLGDRRHVPPAIRPWMGDSVGWWEGDTLVVETTNFNPGERWHWNRGSYVLVGEGARIVERFTRTAPDVILYRYEVTDPSAYTQTWKGEMPLNAAKGPILEYACHEGNYAIRNILAGGRAQEQAKAAATP